jgi:CP family cyanate transporter-like MFS transporter
MPPESSQPATGRPLAVLGALFLATLALRPQLVGIGPLLPAIQTDLGVSFAVAGLLGTIPVLLMGAFAPLGPWVAGRIGPRQAIALCLVGVIVFGAARALAPGIALVLVTTIGIGLGMGTAGALLPIVVKLRAVDVPARATGAYAAGIVTGALIAAAVAVPLALELGSWRWPLLLFAVAGIASLAAWLVLLPGDDPSLRGTGRPPRLPWRHRTAWLLAGIFGAQSMLYYTSISWLPAVYVERGWSEPEAGNLVAIIHLVGLAAGIVIPFLADRAGSRRSQLVSIAAVTCVGLAGFIALPDAAVIWAAVIGVGLGAIFPLCLTLPVDVADRAASVGAVAAFMLLGGYVTSSIGPVGLGLIRDATGDFTVGLWIVLGLGIALLVACSMLTPTRLHRGVDRSPAVASEI